MSRQSEQPTPAHRQSGRIPLRPGQPDAVRAAMSRVGFMPLPAVGDTTPFQRESDMAEAEWVQAAPDLHWLDFRDLPAGEVETLFQALPRLSVAEVLGHLRDDHAEVRLQGLREAGLLQADELADAVVALTRDPNPQVAADAKALLAEVSGIARGTPAAAYRAFDTTLDAHDRRQVIRWLLHDAHDANQAVRAVVAAALADPDWEVRASAIIAVARFRLLDLAEQLAACPLPKVSRLGPKKLDRDMLFAIKQAALWCFAGETLPETPPEELKPWRWWHIRRLVMGLPPAEVDHAFLLVHALTQPLAMGEPPLALPRGVEDSPNGYRLVDTDIELAWVPPVPHWLGDEGVEGNPPKQATEAGFFIWRDVWRGAGGAHVVTYDQVEVQLSRWRQATGADLILPTGAQWEMAARGADARRFPWGNGYEGDWWLRASPWGLFNLFGEPPCWCRDGERWHVAGGEKVLPVAEALAEPAFGQEATLRPVVRCVTAAC